jgi:hypothetical protein
MRFLTFLLCFVVLSGLSVAQTKYLVSPENEVIPLPAGKSAKIVIDKYEKSRKAASVTDACSGGTVFGYDLTHFPFDSRFGFSHKDVMGEYFVAPARGTIDSFYWRPNGTISAVDSLVIVRIFKSFIDDTHGPGFGGYPRPCRSWGYYTNTSDLENGVAAFVEDATDPTWHSTIELNGGTSPSFPPFGKAIWGLSGVPTKLVPGVVNSIGMNIIPGGLKIKSHTPSAQDTIDIGEAMFFSLKMNSNPTALPYPDANPTQFGANGNNAPYPPYPPKMWKFYEHDSGPSNCSGFTANSIKKGWVARGALVDDSTAGSAYNVWYLMTPTTNVPPKIQSVAGPPNTISTGAQTIDATIVDCDAENPAKAGVKTASIRYSFLDLAGNTLSTGSGSLSNIGGDTWEGSIPGSAKNTRVQYKVFATDSLSLADSTTVLQYKIVDFNSAYYQNDTTGVGCTPLSIVGTGNVIDTSKWFLPPGTSNIHPGDDGSSGPYSLGGPFVYFGDTMRYAWVGVNGAIALSKTATDTLDVNSNGYATNSWDLPQRQHQGRHDTTNRAAGFMPKNCILPFWADWIVKQDSPLATFGHIRWSNSAFANKFIVEYDSVGTFDATGSIPDNDVFRVILDRSTGSIQFQYPSVGLGGNDTLNLIGLNADSLKHPGPITPYNHFNKDRYPIETHPHNNLCVTYNPVLFQVAATDGWNMVSVASNPPSHSKPFLYPTAVSPSAFGTPMSTVDDTLFAGWNMVGSVTTPVPVSSLTTTPPGIVSSPYFGFSGSYFVATTLTPGKGAWVKTTGAGKLHIVGTGAVPKQAPGIAELSGLDKLTVQDKQGRAQTLYIGSDGILNAQRASTYEMPPAAPDGALNVRFASQRMVEVYPAQVEAGKQYEYPVVVEGASYPLVVKWEAARGSSQKLTLVAAAGKESKVLGIMEGAGKVTITDAAVTKLVVRLTAGLAVPKEFALSQNYPNPFNPTTHFSVDIPRASVVDVTVYDVLGRKITTLMTGEQEAGYHIMEWDSKDSHGMTVPSGMYMVRMTAGDFSAVKKIMLMK